MPDHKKLCSVVIPAYNCERTIRLSVESALRQTHSRLELLIADDASTDNTGSVLKALASEDSRIRLFLLEKNGGVAEARNRLLTEAKGDYIAFLDADDIWEPAKVAKQITLLETSGADFTYASYSFMDKDSRPMGKPKIVPPTCTLKDILKENFILCSSVMMKGSLGKQYRMDGSYSHEDMVYWLTLFQGGALAVGDPEVLVRYRLYDQNRSGNKKKAAKDRWIVYRRFLQMNICLSCAYFVVYALHGFKKYRSLRK
ncbi:MAG: glycosyltransferase family 2 protein [Sphaerochaeta sp.]|nr:glycosyltransferase family 2 protein [Sphaerochaeta sp.]